MNCVTLGLTIGLSCISGLTAANIEIIERSPCGWTTNSVSVGLYYGDTEVVSRSPSLSAECYDYARAEYGLSYAEARSLGDARGSDCVGSEGLCGRAGGSWRTYTDRLWFRNVGTGIAWVKFRVTDAFIADLSLLSIAKNFSSEAPRHPDAAAGSFAVLYKFIEDGSRIPLAMSSANYPTARENSYRGRVALCPGEYMLYAEGRARLDNVLPYIYLSLGYLEYDLSGFAFYSLQRTVDNFVDCD